MANGTIKTDCSEENGDVIMAENANTNAVSGADVPSVPSRSVVHYKSTALDEIGMLKNRPVSEVMNCPGVLAASETAEKVRELFKEKERLKREEKLKKSANNIPIVGDDKIDKAERYDRRTKLNRQSAAASRVRKEAYIKALEEQLWLHNERLGELERSYVEEQTAHSKLKQDVQTAAQIVAPSASSAHAIAHAEGDGNVVKQEEHEAVPDLVPTPISPNVIDQIFTNPNPPVPSNEIELNLPPLPLITPEDLMGFNIPFELVPQQFLENTAPDFPELNIDEMLK